MKAVLLAGGLGTRMREETEFRPKPMVEIGGEPILEDAPNVAITAMVLGARRRRPCREQQRQLP